MEEQNNKEPPKNLCFEYRGINHVIDPLSVESEDVFKAEVIEKYRLIDKGLGRKVPFMDNKLDLRPDFAKIQADIHALRVNKEIEDSGQAELIESLQQQIKELQAAAKPMVGYFQGKKENIPSLGDPPEVEVTANDKGNPEIEPETMETLGPGKCYSCMKEFKRLDMHVCKKAK